MEYLIFDLVKKILIEYIKKLLRKNCSCSAEKIKEEISKKFGITLTNECIQSLINDARMELKNEEIVEAPLEIKNKSKSPKPH